MLMIGAANSEHQYRKLYDQEITYSVIELLLVLLKFSDSYGVTQNTINVANAFVSQQLFEDFQNPKFDNFVD